MNPQRINEIDLYRFFAALAVLIHHYSFRGFAADGLTIMPYPLLAPFGKYGYLGVELFFMISGFVILRSATSGRLRPFIISRVVRLYPAFWAICTLTFVTTLLIGAPRFSATLSQYIANMSMLSGFFGVPSIDGAYWTLFIEIRFYLLVSIVLFFKKIQQAQSLLIAWLALSISLEWLDLGDLRRFFIVDYSAYFIAGATYYLIWSQGSTKTRWLIIAVSLVMALYQSINGLTNFEKHYQSSINAFVVAAIIGTFYLVMGLAALRLSGWLGNRSWQTVGALTYPMYLLHQYVGYMVFNLAYPAFNAHVLFWGMLCATIIMAYGVHRFVEQPLAPRLKSWLNSWGSN